MTRKFTGEDGMPTAAFYKSVIFGALLGIALGALVGLLYFRALAQHVIDYQVLVLPQPTHLIPSGKRISVTITNGGEDPVYVANTPQVSAETGYIIPGGSSAQVSGNSEMYAIAPKAHWIHVRERR